MMDLHTYLTILNLILLNTGLALSQYIVLRAGVFSIATAGYASLGAYCTAILVMRTGLYAPAALALAALLGAVMGAVLALPLARLRGIYTALATLAFVEIVGTLAFYFEGLTGGPLGLNNIPKLVGTWELLLAVGIVVYALTMLDRSAIGRALDTIRQDEVVAASLGISVIRHHILVFVLSGAIGAFFGGLASLYIYSIEPQQFGFRLLVSLLAFVVLGGRSTILGPLVGTAILTILPDVARPLGENRELIHGLLLIVVITFLPQGVADSTIHFLRRRRFARKATAKRGHVSPLRLENVTKRFGGVEAVGDLTLDVPMGTITGLIGPNGAGKTTVVNLITGILQLTNGRILVGDQDMSSVPADRVARAGIARTFQNIRLLGEASVLDNVMIGFHRHETASVLDCLLGLRTSRRETIQHREQARALLARFAMGHFADHPAGGLSYGDQRRVEIIRALATAPKILLLDEPVAGMNDVEAHALGDTFVELAKTGTGLLLIEHNMRFVQKICQNVYVLDSGKLIARGAPANVMRDPAVITAYLGAT